MNPEICIRRATQDDAIAVAKVHVKSWQSTYAGILPENKLRNLNLEKRNNVWSQILGNESETQVVATHEEKVVGFLTGGIDRKNNRYYRGELYGIYLLKAFQGRGIGSALVEELVHDLLKKGVTRMKVTVLMQNSSRAFYERLGGVIIHYGLNEIFGRTLFSLDYGFRDIRHLSK